MSLRVEIESLFNPFVGQESLIAFKKNIDERVAWACSASFYCLEGIGPEEFKEKGHRVFVDSVIEKYHIKEYDLKWKGMNPDYVVEVGFLPGVTDNPALAAEEGLSLLDLNVKAASGKVWFFWGKLSMEKLEKFAQGSLGNPLIQHVETLSYRDYEKQNRFEQVVLPKVLLTQNAVVTEYSLDQSIEKLEDLSQERCLALSRKEWLHIIEYFKDDKIQKQRASYGLSKSLTDVELEIVAQTWSEHCKHKIFAAEIEYSETRGTQHPVGEQVVDGLYPTWIKGATRRIERERGIDWTKSVFSDNAGVVRFDSKIDFCIKVETHNAPSALDPYGGSLTGILGVNRDILGVGLGAWPIANMNVFCVGPWKRPNNDQSLPKGVIPPKNILKGVHKGIQDGGNKSGIPTVNGAITFDPSYLGRPLIFCGTVGVLPRLVNLEREGGDVDGFQKYVRSEDRIFMVGGAIGADGIHGATFSSQELDENAPATAVQIGDPFTQRRVWDFLVEAQGLYSAITDNGAGGLSSSVGEMATLTGGATLDLEKCPVKYPGLAPWELMISESQERMTLAVPPENVGEFCSLAQKREICVSNLGFFNNSGFLHVTYGEKTVAHLSLHFLHESLPKMKLIAHWDGPREEHGSFAEEKKIPDKNWEKILKTLLARENIASKEHWVARYDQGVKGATHLRPFIRCAEEKGYSPADAGIICAGPHGGEEDNALAIGCGLVPSISPYDPYLMAQFAVDEAVRNVVASGADIDQLCLLDNFCWPNPIQSKSNPDGDYKLGQLVRSCAGLYDICCAYGTPLVSGKDSMKNDFKGLDEKGEPFSISVVPTLLVTALGRCRLGYTRSSAFQSAGDLVYLLGGRGEGLLGSEYERAFVVKDARLPSINVQKNKSLYRQLREWGLQKTYEQLSRY